MSFGGTASSIAVQDALGLTLRNRWGKGDDLTVTLDTLSMTGIPDPYITLHNPTVDYDSIGTYSPQDAGRIYTGELFTGWEKPFYITVAHDCPNDYIFTLNVTMSCTNGMDPEDTAEYVTQGTVTLQVRSGKVLPSVISEDMTPTSDNLYIIPSGTVITKGTTVNVEPGTHIQFWTADPEEPYANTYMASLCVNGILNINGTRENPVYIYPSDLMSEYAVQMYAKNGGELNMTWADVTNLIMYYNEGGSYSVSDGYITTADHCTFRMNYGDGHIRYRNLRDGTVHDQLSNSGMMTHFRLATNCVFYKMALTYGLDVRGTLDGCIFADSALNFYQYGYSVRNCVFLGNCVGIETWEGRKLLTTVIENGTQYFTISGGYTVTHVSEGESCTQPGSVTYTATADFYGERFTDSRTVHKDMLGHDYAWTVLTEPGCSTEGLRLGECRRCGDTTREPIAPLGHDWEGNSCRRCGQVRSNPFTDVPDGSFFYDPVLWAVKNGVTSGATPTTFGPNAICNRAQVVTFLYRTFS